MTLLNRRDIILNSLGVTMHEIWDGIASGLSWKGISYSSTVILPIPGRKLIQLRIREKNQYVRK